MTKLSKAQRKAQALAISAKWRGVRCTDSVAQVKAKPMRKHGVIQLVRH